MKLQHVYVYATQRKERGEQFAVGAEYEQGGSFTLALFGDKDNAQAWATSYALDAECPCHILPSAE